MMRRNTPERYLYISCLAGLLSVVILFWNLPLPPATAQTCTFTLDHGSQPFASGGGSGSVTVTASQASCAWTATSNAPWLTITAGATNAGNGTTGYTVAANPATVQRTGTLTVAGQTFTVTQAAGVSGLMFYPLSHPIRLLDTRPGQVGCDAPGQPIPGGASRTQTARRTCDGLTIPNNAMAITGNITTVQSGGGYLTLYPSDAAQPLVANSNYNPDEILNNVFTVGLGNADGAFKIFVTSTTDIVIDVTGYYAPPGANGLFFHPLPRPIRLLETRAGFTGCNTPSAPLPGNADTAQQARLTCDGVTIPNTALAITGNATTVNPGGPGFPYLTLFPANATRPLVASSNYLPGQIMNAPFTVGLSPAGEFKIYPTTQTDLVIDVLGYYSADASDANGAGLLFNSLPHPVRLLETRAGFTGCSAPGALLLTGSTRTQPARGLCDGVTIAADALGIVGNATVVNAAGGYLTFWPSSASQPLVATSNFDAGQVFNRHFTVGLGAGDGAFKIFTQFQTDLVVDLSGYFSPLPANQAPAVDAGADQTIALASSASLAGNVADDGLPLNGTLTAGWSKVSGPGNVTFGNVGQVTTTATFSSTGIYVLRLTASDSQLTVSDDLTVTVNSGELAVNAGSDQIVTLPNTGTLVGSVTGGMGAVTINWTQMSGPGTVIFGNAGGAISSAIFSTNGVYVLRLTATDSQITLSDELHVTVNPDPALPPPDPSTIAPPLDTTVAMTLGTATEFLYTGPNPIQTGVAPGTINPIRVAVLRGRVLNKAGAPLPMVKITILDHPEFGQTLSRADGMFDLAVNGGGLLTVCYEKMGFIAVQRQAQTPWQDYVMTPDVVMMAYDSQVTAIDLNASMPIQVAQGSMSSDSDGNRKATLMIPQGTTAMMVLPNGSMQGLNNIHVRATEYTVGSNGPDAMPAQLPATSGYTYALEYSLDEAIVAGAKDVRFSQPLAHYAENFLNFPIGGIVPAGYYDREKGIWVPSENGRVVKILSINNALANLDIDGSNTPASDAALAELGVTTAERQQLATLYQAGQSLWRVPIDHFTPWDYNWPVGPPSDAKPPEQPDPQNDKPEDDPCSQSGSIIECQNQTLREDLGVSGTPFRLHYSSERVAGRKSLDGIDISLTKSTVPASLKRIDLQVSVAGRTFTQSFPVTPNQATTFVWNRQDAYGRSIEGKQPVNVRIGYVYNGVYQTPAQFGQSFALLSGVPISGNTARQEITVWQDQKGIAATGGWDARKKGLGGLSLNIHHSFDPVGKVLYSGDGSRRSTNTISSNIITTAHTNNLWSVITSIASAPDGTLYAASQPVSRVFKVSPTGIITVFAGTGVHGFNGDGGLATQANLNAPDSLALAPDGSLYIADVVNNRIRKVNTNGIITTFAGTGTQGYSGDGGPAIQAQFNQPRGIALAADGSLYVADYANHFIRRISPNGVINKVAGNGSTSYIDGLPATQTGIGDPEQVALDSEGNIYFSAPLYVRKIGTNGIIRTIAGSGVAPFFSGDGGPATQAGMNNPYNITLSKDGSLHISDAFNNRIRKVAADGIITTTIGNGSSSSDGDNGPPAQAGVTFPRGTVISPNGNLQLGAGGAAHIRQVKSSLPGVSTNDTVVSSKDGSEAYIFNSSGRHLRTIETLTNVVRYQFAYDNHGYLTTVTDRDNNVTTIERDTNGNPTGILSPFGQHTALSLNVNGYVSGITNPAGESTQLAYTSEGLLTSMTTPRGQFYQFNYDVGGRLIKDTDPAGGFKAPARTAQAQGYSVALSTSLGRTNTYQVENLSTGDQKRTNTAPSGLQTVSVIGKNGTNTHTLPDGTVNSSTFSGDPRWSMQSPLLKSQTITTGGLTANITGGRTVSLSDPTNPLSLTTQTDTLNINGRTYTSVYASATKTTTSTSPLGRQIATTLNTQGRIAQRQVTGLLPVSYTYDNRGRLATVSQGSGADTRTTSLAYNSSGYIATITDPLGRLSSFGYDAAGRVLTESLPGGRVIGYSYDAQGNVTTVTPPGRPAHSFTYTPIDLVSAYIPPNVGAGTNQTTYTYNADRQPIHIGRPDGLSIDYGYDSAGRISALTLPTGQVTYAYHPTTGKLTAVNAPGGIGLSYSYQGALLTNSTWTGPVSGTVSRTYDNNYRVTSQSINGGDTVNFQYDNDGLLTQAGGLAISRNTQTGLVTGHTLGNVTDTLSYNSFPELTGHSAAYNGNNLYSVQYLRDKLSRITQKTETINGVISTYNYAYDLANRLNEVRKNGVIISTYTYDNNGNRLSYNDTVTATYDDQDRLTQYGGTTFTYTANGELLTKTASSQTTTYEYDVLGNLKKVTLPGNQRIEYMVDGKDRRIGKKVNGAFVQGFLYQDGLRIVAELDSTNNVASRFVYAGSSNKPAYMIKEGNTYRIITTSLDKGSLR